MTELYVAVVLTAAGLAWAALMRRKTPDDVVINGYYYRVFLILLTVYFAYMLFTQEIEYPFVKILLSFFGIFTLYGVIESFRFKLYFDEAGFRYRRGLRWTTHSYSDIVDIRHLKRDKSARSLFYEMEEASFSISDGMYNAGKFYEYVLNFSELTGLHKLESLEK